MLSPCFLHRNRFTVLLTQTKLVLNLTPGCYLGSVLWGRWLHWEPCHMGRGNITILLTKYHHLPTKVENLRVAVLAAKAYTALALGDYIPAGSFAKDLLARCRLQSLFSFTSHWCEILGKTCLVVTNFLRTSTRQRVSFFKTKWVLWSSLLCFGLVMHQHIFILISFQSQFRCPQGCCCCFFVVFCCCWCLALYCFRWGRRLFI